MIDFLFTIIIGVKPVVVAFLNLFLKISIIACVINYSETRTAKMNKTKTWNEMKF